MNRRAIIVAQPAQASGLRGNSPAARDNPVYREYTKGLSDEEERKAAMRNAEEENERA
jgi:hypothetical protein